MLPRTQTSCECPDPGFCLRHKLAKGRILWLACQRDEALFQFWEQQARNETPHPIPPQPLPRCQHRGREVLETVPCELCGNRSVQVPIHPCAIHGRCTERRFGNSTESSRTISACTTCSKYLPVADDSDPR